MSEKTKEIKVGEEVGVQSAEEFEALLAEYKKSNPEKFAEKEKKGEFDRFRAKHGWTKASVKETPAEEPKEEKKTKK